MNLSRKLVNNFLSLSGARVVLNVINFLVIAYLARVLGEEGFGIIGFAVAFISYFELLVNPGLNLYGTNEIARCEKNLSGVVSDIISIKFFLAIICYTVLLIVFIFIDKPLNIKLLIAIYGLGLFAMPTTLYWLFQGTQDMHWISIGQSFNRLFYLVFIFLFVKGQEDIFMVSVSHIGAAYLAMGIIGGIFVKKYGFPKLNLNFSRWREILLESFPMGFSSIMIAVYLNLDLVILGFLKPFNEVGLYNSAVKVMMIVNLFFGVVLQVFYPNFSKFGDNLEKLKNIVHYYHKSMILLALPVGFGSTLLAEPILSFLFGEAYVSASVAFIILAWTKVIVALNISLGNPLLAWGKQVKYMKIVTVGAVTNLIANLILIPRWGIEGAAFATFLAEFAVFVGVFNEFQKKIPSTILKLSIKPLIASLMMSLAIIFLKPYLTHILFLILTIVIVYFTFLIALKGITKQELQLIFRSN